MGADGHGRLRTMVVDDSRAMRSMLKKLLVDVGAEVIAEAGNGVEALERIKATGPLDLALIDWNMPTMNGFELLCALRKDPSLASMRVMFVTTETEADQVLRALDAGADEYLIKPFAKEALADKLALMGLVG